MRYILILVGSLFFLGMVIATEAVTYTDSRVSEQKIEIYDATTFTKESEFFLTQTYDNLSMAVADLGRDGQAEIIIGASPGELPEVIILRSDGSEISRWMAYGSGYRGGVLLASADVNNDGYNDIITGTRETGGPHVRIFSGQGELISQWFAFKPEYRTGVKISVGEVVASSYGKEVLAVQNEGQKSLLRVFSYKGELLSEWYPFGEDFYGGLNMEVTPNGQILVSKAFGISPLVRMFDRYGGVTNEFMAYYDNFTGGVQLQTLVQKHGGWDIFTAPGFTGGPHIRNFAQDGRVLSPGFLAFNGEYHGGLVFDAGDVDGDGNTELVVGMGTVTPGPNSTIKSIVVDLSEQKLTSFFRGYPQKTYNISSGLARTPTPVGEYKIRSKIESTRMSWYYGEDNPDNYDLPNVPHVMSFNGPYTIHGAYWHNNFGHPMSHGCVNMSLPDAEEIYGWADIGTTVIIQS